MIAKNKIYIEFFKSLFVDLCYLDSLFRLKIAKFFDLIFIDSS